MVAVVDFTVILIWLTYLKPVVLAVVELVDMVEAQLLMLQMQLQTLVQVAVVQDILQTSVVLVVLVLL